MLGDVMFFKPTDWQGKLVAWLTGGQYCHVAVEVDDGKIVEAIGRGVVLNPYRRPDAVLSVAPRVEADELYRGIQVVCTMVGMSYAHMDLINALLRKFKLPVHLGINNAADCSHLAADYLVAVGLLSAGEVDEGLSPNDLARRFGVR